MAFENLKSEPMRQAVEQSACKNAAHCKLYKNPLLNCSLVDPPGDARIVP